MKNGGILGFHCAHQYAYTDETTNQRLPHALKGIDVVLFTIFRTLGLTVHVRPILDKEFSEDDFLPASRITRAAPEFRAIKIVGEDIYWELDDNEVRHTASSRELNWGDAEQLRLRNRLQNSGEDVRFLKMFCESMKRLVARVKLPWHLNSGWETRRRLGGGIRLWQCWSRFLCFRREN